MKKKKLLVGKMKRFKALFITLVMVMFSGQMATAQEFELSGIVTGDQFIGVDIALSGITLEVTPTIIELNDITVDEGSYSFLVDDGIYTVTPTFEGCSFTPENTEVIIIGASVPQVNFVSNCVCIPATECSAGSECGVESDNCGGSIDCGSCDAGFTCNDAANICEEDPCVPETECSVGSECGVEDDGCGGTIDCGTCDAGFTCNDAANICEEDPCVPETECSVGSECGVEDDGCGGTIDCGTCDAGFTCNDAANICEEDPCVPETECSVGSECGVEDDGCGGTIDCGTCDAGFTCNDAANICEEDPCVPETECSVGSECGVEDDGCGGTIDCGTCDAGESCDINVCIDTPDNDDDGDGVTNENDECPETPAGEIIDSNGCSINDMCACDNEWKNHGAYVRCVAHASEDFVDLGLISEAEKDYIVSDAALSECGRKKHITTSKRARRLHKR